MKKNAVAALIILVLTIIFLFVVNGLPHSKGISGSPSAQQVQQMID